jgi:hypothetical protein
MTTSASPLITKARLVQTLRESIPDTEWFLKQIESEQGWYRFPQVIADSINNLKLGNYPMLYVSEAAIANMLFRVAFDTEQRRELEEEMVSAAPEERAELVEGLVDVLDQTFEGFELPKTATQQEEARKAFEALSPDEREEAVRVAQGFMCFMLCTFHQNLSMMVHGEKLTALVAQAQAGDDRAFVKAVQIDRRILSTVPYFKERYERSQMEADRDFSDRLAYRLGRAPYVGKIRHKTLWLSFSLLDQSGWLDSLPHREILDMLDEAGVGGNENRIQDVKYLSKRIAEYRRFQKRGVLATP